MVVKNITLESDSLGSNPISTASWMCYLTNSLNIAKLLLPCL